MSGPAGSLRLCAEVAGWLRCKGDGLESCCGSSDVFLMPGRLWLTAVVIHLYCVAKEDERKLLAVYMQLIWYYCCFIFAVSDL